MKQKRIGILMLLCAFTLSALNAITVKQPQMKLKYNKPATNWMTSALPIGNGVFGGMFFGGVTKEEIQFNDKTLWTGSKTSRGSYQNFGSVILNFPSSHDNYSNYERSLNLDEAIGRVSYTSNGVNYLREYFASYPDNSIVMRISTPNSKGKLSFSVDLEDAHTGKKGATGNIISINGNLTTISYEAQLKVMNEGGNLSLKSNSISVENADIVTIILTGATNYDIAASSYKTGNATQLHTKVSDRIESASSKTFDELKSRHLNDYQPLYNRVKLDLGMDIPDITTQELAQYNNQSVYLDVLYFQYGRYLMLGSSRGIDLPSNLQGLWNNSNSPAWQSDIHSNINVQMNYWPSENTNLSECHFPFLNYIKKEALRSGGSWQKMANTVITDKNNGEKMDGYRGWTVRTQNNTFGYSDWNWNRPANAWYCTHLWKHFAFTQDTTFLKNDAFPTMKSACEFWFDRLITDSNGKLVAPDEWSPEQGGWEDNIAYAQQLIWELFDNTLKAAKIIKADEAFIAELTNKFEKLDNGVSVGDWGQIKEWTTDKDKLDNKGNEHRHLSQLIALYPGNQISDHIDPKTANAARVILNSRGDGGTGWSRAWKIPCWARLFDGEHAYKLLKSALNLTSVTSMDMTNAGGVYENLFDAHPPFQIDGNFGATAGITEMLIQSNLGFIQLLPALPSVWSQGSFSGLKAEGNFTIDLEWENSLPKQASILSSSGNPCQLYYPNIKVQKIETETGRSVAVKIINENTIAFPTNEGERYIVSF